MNDKTISKLISTIHSTILIFFFILAFILSSSFMALQNGIKIDTLLFPSIKINKLYIKWNKKLTLEAEEVFVTDSNTNETRNFNLKNLSYYLKRYASIRTLVESINIKNIIINTPTNLVHLNYNNRVLYVAGQYDSLHFNTNTYLTKENIYINALLTVDDYNTSLKTNSYYNLNDYTLYSNIHTTISDNIDVTVLSKLTDKKIEYTAFSNKKVTDLSHLSKALHVKPIISKWYVQYLDKSYAQLNNLYGYVDFNNTRDALKNLNIQATAYDVNYTFDEQLPPVSGKEVAIYFKDAKLTIIPPHNALYSNQAINYSHIDIDFTHKDVLLELVLKLKAKANQDIVDLLSVYNIPLPFKQTKGLVDANIKLGINLETIDVSVDGYFKAKDSQFAFEKTLIDVNSTTIALHNTTIEIDSLHVNLDSILEADIEGRFDANDNLGTLYAKIIKFSPSDDNSIHLATNSPLELTYNFNPKQDNVYIKANKILINSQELNFSSFSMPFNLNTMSSSFTGISFNYGQFSNFYLSGKFNLSQLSTELDVDLIKYNRHDVQLNQTALPIHVIYDDSLSIHIAQNSHLLVNHVPITLKPLYLSIKDNTLKFKRAYLDVNKFLQTSASGHYDFSQSKGQFKLHNIHIENKDLGSLFKDNKNARLNLHIQNNSLKIDIPRYSLRFYTHKNGWRISFDDISKFSSNSSLMKEYDISKGFMHISSRNSELALRGKIDYPYALLLKENKPVHSYSFFGTLSKKNTLLRINTHTTLSIDDDAIYLSTKNEFLNFPEIVRFIENHNKNSENNTTDSNSKLFIEAKNTKIVISEKSSILSDRLSITKDGNALRAQLEYKNGGAMFEMNDKLFYMYGKNFNDSFINSIMTTDDIKGGKTSFVLKGSPKDFSGAVKVQNTLLKDYKLINNILAFVNTIPSLTTFSLPHYNNNGLPVSEAYSGFSLKNKILKFSDISIHSPELDIIGNGYINLLKRDMDINLELQTDLGTTMAQVPMVGYLIFGEDGRVSTSLKIDGSLDNPKVSNGLAQDIVVAPFNIIKRTLTYPFKVYKDSIR